MIVMDNVGAKNHPTRGYYPAYTVTTCQQNAICNLRILVVNLHITTNLDLTSEAFLKTLGKEFI